MINKRSTYIGAAIFLVFVVGLASWFFWISPNNSETSSLTEDREALEIKNDALEREVKQLKIDNERLPELRAELANYRIGIPTELELDKAINELQTIATNNQVYLISLGASEVEDSTVEETQPTAEPTPSASPDPTSTATTESADDQNSDSEANNSDGVATTFDLALDGFHQLQQNFEVYGTPDNVLNFLQEIQTVTERHYLIGQISIDAQTDGPASSKLPQTSRGDVLVSFSSLIYVLEKTEAGERFPDPSITPTPEPTEMPPASPGKNPWRQNVDTN